MKRIAYLTACITALWLPASAIAQQALDPDQLAACMAEHSGETEETAMRQLLIAAMQDDTTGMRDGVAELGSVILRLSVSSCGVGLTQLEEPAFQLAAEKYGEILAVRIMENAFSKLQ